MPLSATCLGDKLVPLRFDIEGNKASISGATADATVLFIGYGRSWDGERYASRFERYRAFVTADAKGEATVQFRREFAANGVFAAVDLRSGRCGSVSTSTDDGKDRRKPFDPAAVRPVNGKAKKVIVSRSRAYLVVIRPEVGTWDLLAGDGSALDDDQTVYGIVSFDVAKLQPGRKSGPVPDSIEKGDIILLFSPNQPALSFTRVAE
ncbi:MAG TPA: hypothetical protein VF911_19300 [Thermoanaerobaculia bacterium]